MIQQIRRNFAKDVVFVSVPFSDVVANFFLNVLVVLHLFWHGANANIVDGSYHNFRPIHWAAETGNADMVKWLLSAGADPNIKNSNNHTPYDIATILHKDMIVANLLPKPIEIIKKEAKHARRAGQIERQVRYKLGLSKRDFALLKKKA